MVSSAPQAKPVFQTDRVAPSQAGEAPQIPPHIPTQPQPLTQAEYEAQLYASQMAQSQAANGQPDNAPTQYNVPDQQGWWQGPLQPQQEYLIAEWEADSRVTTPRSRQYYSSLAVIVLLASLILFFAGQTLLIFVLLAFLFISYVLNSIHAERIIHQITTYGIRYRGEKLYYWEQLGRFWVRNNRGHLEVHVEAPTHFGNELILLPSPEPGEESVMAQDLVDVFSRYLLYEEPVPSQMDRWVMWLQDKFPLE
jgi:hypothetical protein